MAPSSIKILAISDFHGKFPKLLKEDKDFDVIMTPGDFCPFAKIRKIIFKNWESRHDWFDIVGRRNAAKIVKESVAKGGKVVARLVGYGRPVFGIPGNVDFTPIKGTEWHMNDKDLYKEYTSLHKNYVDVHYRSGCWKGYSLVGYGESSYPEKQASKKMFKKSRKRLGTAFKRAKKSRLPIIFICHNPPFGILDRVLMKSSPMYGEHLGSEVALDAVKRFKPLVVISGHMHEQQGRRKLGKTTVVNCGEAGRGQYAMITIKNGKVKVSLRGNHRKK